MGHVESSRVEIRPALRPDLTPQDGWEEVRWARGEGRRARKCQGVARADRPVTPGSQDSTIAPVGVREA